tara:strand:+ start:945 stop:1118 length:174 start_codon:yes stop_codon:yes gene_type:complete
MLTEKEVSTLTEIVEQLKKINMDISECSDLWLSDVNNLATMVWKLDAIARTNTEDKD